MNIPNHFLRTSLLTLAGALLAACFDTTTAVPETEKEPKAISKPSVGMRTGYMFYSFYRYYEAQSDGGSGVEKFVDCPEGWVLTGWGGRVNGDGNFTDIRIQCKRITEFGGLENWPNDYPSDNTARESWVTADAGYAVVGVGGVVNSQNLVRAVIKQCPWVNSNSVNPGLCTYKSSDGSQATELFWDIHNTVPATSREYKVLTGIGATAGFEALKTIRGTIGVLKRVPLMTAPLTIPAGFTVRYSFTVPPGGQNVKITTANRFPQFGENGDASLYVGFGFEPTQSYYSCRSNLPGYNEACYFQSPGVYHVLVTADSGNPSPYLRGEYTLE